MSIRATTIAAVPASNTPGEADRSCHRCRADGSRTEGFLPAIIGTDLDHVGAKNLVARARGDRCSPP